jgi:paraquat-inducible protein B
VMVLCSIGRENFPELTDEQSQAHVAALIARGLRLQMIPNLLTGQSFLQADYFDPNRFKTLEIAWEPKYPYVSSMPASITTLKQSVDKVLLRLQELDLAKLAVAAEGVLASVDQAIVDAQVAGISGDARALLADARKQVNDLNTAKLSSGAQHALASVDQAVADVNVPVLSQGIQSLIAEVRQTNVHLQKVLASPKPLAEPSNLPEMIARLNKTLGRIDRLVATERPQIEMVLANFKDISDDLKDLTASLKQHPSDLLFSTPPSQSEALK